MPNRGSAERPNLVFIFPDRLRRDSMACYGNDWIQSRELNALAECSLVFENCYVTQPVCAPARSSIVSGLYPTTAEMPVNRLVMPDRIAVVALAEENLAGAEALQRRRFDNRVKVFLPDVGGDVHLDLAAHRLLIHLPLDRLD